MNPALDAVFESNVKSMHAKLVEDFKEVRNDLKIAFVYKP